jgi:acyl-CoA synthetase (AMP-forming)/AMP-acid ligase II
MGDWYVKQTIGLLLERAAEQWGPCEALVFQGRRWTFAEMHAHVDAVAEGLCHSGTRRGTRSRGQKVGLPAGAHED